MSTRGQQEQCTKGSNWPVVNPALDAVTINAVQHCIALPCSGVVVPGEEGGLLIHALF